MSKFADALRAREMEKDPLMYVVREIAESDLPPESAAKIIQHIEAARAKHPYVPKKHKSGSLPDMPDTRPSSLSAVADALDKLAPNKKDTDKP